MYDDTLEQNIPYSSEKNYHDLINSPSSRTRRHDLVAVRLGWVAAAVARWETVRGLRDVVTLGAVHYTPCCAVLCCTRLLLAVSATWGGRRGCT